LFASIIDLEIFAMHSAKPSRTNQNQPVHLSTSARATTILIADAGIADLDVLLDGLDAGVEPRLVAPGADARGAIAEALATPGLQTLHLLAHGAPGQIHLGGRALTAADFASGRDGAAERDLDIALWSCHAGAGEAGRRFVAAVADATGARVAAAQGLVGDAAQGGSWELSAAVRAPFGEQARSGFRQTLDIGATVTYSTVTRTQSQISALGYDGVISYIHAVSANITTVTSITLTDATVDAADLLTLAALIPRTGVTSANASAVTTISGAVADIISAEAITSITGWSPAIQLTLTDTAANLLSAFDTHTIPTTFNGGSTSNTITGVNATNVGAADVSRLIGDFGPALHPLPVADTAANVQSYLGSLSVHASNISSLAIADTAAALKAAYVSGLTPASLSGFTNVTTTVTDAATGAGDAAILLNDFGSALQPLTVVDTAANVAAHLSTLSAHPLQITSLSIVDTVAGLETAHDSGLTPSSLSGFSGATVTTTTTIGVADVAQLATDFGPLLRVDVMDTAAHVNAQLSALVTYANANNLSSIAVVDTFAALQAAYNNGLNTTTLLQGFPYWLNRGVTSTDTLNVAHATQLMTEYGMFLRSAAVADTAANLQSGLSGLLPHAYSIGSVTLTDTSPATLALSVTAGEVSWLNILLAQMAPNSHVTLALSGTAADLKDDYDSGLTGLASLSGFAGVKVTATGGAADVATLVSDYGSVLHAAVVDTAANVAARLSSLNANAGQISSLSIVDTAAALESAHGSGLTLASLSGLSNVTVTATDTLGVAAAIQLAADFGSGLHAVAVADTAANVQNSLSDLLANAAAIGGITLTDASPATLAYTVTGSDGAALHTLLARISPNNNVTIALSGTAAHLEADYNNGLSGLANLNGFAGVTVTATGIFGAADTALLATDFGSTLQAIVVADTTTNVQSSLGGMFANVGAIGGITLTDSSPATLAYTVTGSEGGALNALLTKIASNNNVTIALSGTAAHLEADFASVMLNLNGFADVTVTATDTASAADAALLLHAFGSALHPIAVVDTAANVSAGLSALALHFANIASLSVVDSAAALLAAHDNGFTASSLSGFSNVTISATHVGAAAAAALIGDYGSALQPLAVVDTAVNVSANLSALVADGSKIASISVSDTVANVLASLPALIAAGSQITSILVSDSAANVQSGLADLLANASHINGITLTDTAPATLAYTVTGSEGTALNTLLAEISPNSHVTTALSGTAASLAADASALGHATTVTATDAATAAQAATILAANAAATFATIGDTAANLALHASALSHATTVTATGTATAAQATAIFAIDPDATFATISDTAANLAAVNASALSHATTVTATGTATAAQAAAIASGNLNAHFATISDTAGNLMASAIIKIALHNATTVTATGTTTIGDAVALYLADHAATSATISGAAADFASPNGTLALYLPTVLVTHPNVTINNNATVAQLTAVSHAIAATSAFPAQGSLSYAGITDSAANLATQSGGAWSVSSFIHSNTNLVISGTLGAGELAAIQAVDTSGTISVLTPLSAPTQYVFETPTDSSLTITNGMVASVIDSPSAGGHTFNIEAGGQLVLNASAGANNIVFENYNAAQLSVSHSGATAIFTDIATGQQIAAITVDAAAPSQTITYADSSHATLSLVGSAITLGGSGPQITLGLSGDVLQSVTSGTGGYSVVAGANANVTFAGASAGTQTVVVTGDTAGNGVTGAQAGSSANFAFTTLNGTIVNGNDRVTLNNAELEVADHGAGGGANLSALVANYATAGAAVDAAMAQAARAATSLIIAGAWTSDRAGVVEWFQYGGDTYLVEAVYGTSDYYLSPHHALGSNDVVIKLTGLVDLGGSQVSGHTLQLLSTQAAHSL
jgi:hypothetical protein